MTEVEWHSYPKERPRKGRYLASVKIGRKKFVTMVDYSRDRGFRPYSFIDFHDSYVKAWAELPEPYKESEPLDMHPDAIAARRYMENNR